MNANPILKSLQNELLDEVYRNLKDLGFQEDMKNQSFMRRFDGGVQRIHLAFINHENDFDTTLDFAIRFDKLEDLVNEDNKAIPSAERKRTSSLGIEFGNLTSGQPRRWTVAGRDDVKKVAFEIGQAIRVAGLPYLEKFSNMQTALETLSGDDSEAWRHSPFHAARASRAVGSAFLLGRQDLFEDLARRKEAFLESRKDFGLKAFQAFKSKLSSRFS